MKLAIYGIGNFGYSFLHHFDTYGDSDLQISAYDFDTARTDYLREHRHHSDIHPEYQISERIEVPESLESLVRDCDIIILSVPSVAVHSSLREIVKYLTKPAVIVNTAKALDPKSGQPLSTEADNILADTPHSYADIAGGTIASDLFAAEPLGATIASSNGDVLVRLKKFFESPTLYIDTTDDIIGVEYAGSFKNVISIAAGIVNGLGMSYGTETHVISRTAGQIADVCVEKFGAKAATFSISSQCWGNDMWMSCTGRTRNRAFGEMIGQGKPVAETLEELSSKKILVEGVNTLRIIKNIPEIYNIPIIKTLHQIVIEQKLPTTAVRDYLMSMY